MAATTNITYSLHFMPRFSLNRNMHPANSIALRPDVHLLWDKFHLQFITINAGETFTIELSPAVLAKGHYNDLDGKVLSLPHDDLAADRKRFLLERLARFPGFPASC